MYTLHTYTNLYFVCVCARSLRASIIWMKMQFAFFFFFFFAGGSEWFFFSPLTHFYQNLFCYFCWYLCVRACRTTTFFSLFSFFSENELNFWPHFVVAFRQWCSVFTLQCYSLIVWKWNWLKLLGVWWWIKWNELTLIFQLGQLVHLSLISFWVFWFGRAISDRLLCSPMTMTSIHGIRPAFVSLVALKLDKRQSMKLRFFFLFSKKRTHLTKKKLQQIHRQYGIEFGDGERKLKNIYLLK